MRLSKDRECRIQSFRYKNERAVQKSSSSVYYEYTAAGSGEGSEFRNSKDDAHSSSFMKVLILKAAEQSVSSLIFVRILLESQTKRTHRQENISLLFTEKSILRRGRRSRRKERKYRMHMRRSVRRISAELRLRSKNLSQEISSVCIN